MTNPIEITGPGRRVGLDHDRIIDGALSLVETGGPEGLTMRKLAAELGVSTTTIYWHAGSRDEIITAVIKRMSERQAHAPIDGTHPRDRVMSAAKHVWQSALTHREVTSLAHRSGSTSLLELDLEIVLARELNAAGLRGTDARDALRAILITVGGFLVLALRDDAVIADERTSYALWAEVSDPDIDPSTIDALTEPIDLPALFERTLRAVVDHYVPVNDTPAATTKEPRP